MDIDIKSRNKLLKEAKFKIVSCHNRMMSLLTMSQRVLLDPALKNMVGIDENFYPIMMGFTGKIKRVPWQRFCTWFKDERIGGEKSYRRALIDHRNITQSIMERIDDNSVSRFVNIVSGKDIERAFLDSRPGSCMSETGDIFTEMRQIYVDNPEIVDMIVFGKDCGLTEGKVSSWLRWKLPGQNWYDRAYYSSSSELISTIKQKVGKKDNYSPLDNPPTYVTMKWSGQRLPYMDCMKYISAVGLGHIVLSSDYKEENYGSCESTKGTLPCKNLIVPNAFQTSADCLSYISW